jgi:predicted phage terminase large subunit-like protein
MIDRRKVATLLMDRVIRNPYIPHEPFVRQAVFLALDDKEAMYGGAAGGGKSDALLMAALMYVDTPGYNAILFRKTYADLNLPEAIMARSHEWLGATDAKWDGADYRWTFPSGATLSFGYLNHDKDKFRYQSAAFQFIGFDELTQFPFEHYSYLFSRLRRLHGLGVPLRMRGGTNPGGIGNDWVYDRFVISGGKTFIPALLSDNLYIDQEEYRKSLAELDETTQKQLELGLWVTDPAGKPFLSDWWRGQNRYLVGEKTHLPIGRFQSWDTALTDKEKSAYSACVTAELMPDYRIRIVDVWKGKPIFPELADAMRDQYQKWSRDGLLNAIVIEGAASGKPAIQTLKAGAATEIGRRVVEFNPKGSKEERGNQAATWCKRGMVLFPHPSPEAAWMDDFERELYNFPDTQFKDQVDAFGQLVIYLENYLVAGWHGILAKHSTSTIRDSRVAKALGKDRR